MDRESLYHLYKDILCRYGIVPRCEEDFESVIRELLNIYFQKNEKYPKE
jgi:hypothetical protein